MNDKQAVELCKKYASAAMSPSNRDFYTEIADIIQRQAEQIERMKCCENCKYGCWEYDEILCEHKNADGDYNHDCKRNNYKDWELYEPPTE